MFVQKNIWLGYKGHAFSFGFCLFGILAQTELYVGRRLAEKQSRIFFKKVKLHTYIAPLEVHGRLICGTLYSTSQAGLLHPTIMWRFQEATYIPMQGGALTCLPSNAMALPVLIYT